MPYLMSDESPEKYADTYSSGQPHIDDTEYRELFNRLYRRGR